MGDLTLASVVTVKRNRQGGFREQARWKDLPITRRSDGAQSVLSTAKYPDGSGGLTPLDFVAQL